jgi:hypothetical protein
MPALTPVKIYRGSPPQAPIVSTPPANATISSVPAVYTVGAGKRLIIKNIRATNLSPDISAQIYIKTGTSVTASNGDYILMSSKVEVDDVLLIETNEILEAGEKIFVWVDAVSAAAVQISGIEVTL